MSRSIAATQMTLSAHEWKSLRRLASTVGMVVPREELKSLLWGMTRSCTTTASWIVVLRSSTTRGEGSTSIAYIKVLPGGFRPTSPDTDPSTEPPSHQPFRSLLTASHILSADRTPQPAKGLRCSLGPCADVFQSFLIRFCTRLLSRFPNDENPPTLRNAPTALAGVSVS